MSLNTTVSTNHKSSIHTISWNESFDKLLTVDDKGMMIVWAESGPDNYIEEMVNEAGSKAIKFAKWSSSGRFIVIVIEGGNLILGSVDGARLWGKEIELEIDFVTFLERDKVILLGDAKGSLVALDSRSGDIFAEYDFHEDDQTKDKPKPNSKATATHLLNKVKVFEGTNVDDFGKILIAYKDGQVYIVHNLRQNYLKKHLYGLTDIQTGVWNKSGKVFVLSGMVGNEPRILFASRSGEVLACLTTKTLQVQLDFNSKGTRLLAAIENTLSVIHVKNSRFSLFVSNENCVVSASEVKTCKQALISTKLLKNEWKVVFMDLSERLVSYRLAVNLMYTLTDGNRVLVVTRSETEKTAFVYTIVDKKGAILHSLNLKFPAKNVQFKNSRVLISINCFLVIWDLSDSLTSTSSVKDTFEKPKIYWFSLKNTQLINNCTHSTLSIFEGEKLFDENFKHLNIVCIDISDNYYYICLEKGTVLRFSVNNFAEIDRLNLNRTAKSIFISKNDTCIAYLDQFSKLEVVSTKIILSTPNAYEPLLIVSAVNEFIWASNSTEFAYSVKNRIFEQSINEIKKDTSLKNNQSVNSNKSALTDGLLIGFSSLEIVTVDAESLELILETQSDVPSLCFDTVCSTTTHKLRTCDLLLLDVSTDLPLQLQEFLQITKNNAVYDYCADYLLGQGKFELAQKLYTHSENFLALKFIEKLKKGVENEHVKKGEALMYLNKTEEAIALLANHNMSPMIPRLLLSYGKIKGIDRFFNLVDANTQNQILTHLGQFYKNTNQLKKAVKVFERINDQQSLIDLHFQTKNYEGLYSMFTDLKDPVLLKHYAEILSLSGNVDLAARAYEKSGESKKAVDTAILGNCWSTGVEIAERQDFKQIDAIIHKFAALLSENKNKLDLVKLYRKAKKNAEAAKILNSLASDLINFKLNPLIIKKVFVLAALEIHLYNKKTTDVNLTCNLTNVTLTDINTESTTKRALTTLITSDLNNISEKILTNPWRGAEAWHALILCLRIFKRGEYTQALKVALRLANFELELGEVRVHSLIAILSFKCKFLKMFSKAISKLETIYTTKGNRKMVERIKLLAVNVFSTNDPKDNDSENWKFFDCLNKNCGQKISEFDCYCKSCNSNFGMCVLSGNNIYVKQYFKCCVCQHKMLEGELEKTKIEFCPLCHSKIKRKIEKKKIV